MTADVPTPSRSVAELPTVLTAFLEVLLNRWLAAAPDGEAARLAGRSVALEIDPPGVGLVLLGAADRLQVLGGLSGEEPDVTLSGTPVGLAAVLARGDRSAVEIRGDAALLGDLQRAFSAVSVDWAGWFEAVGGAGSAGPLLRGIDALRGHLRRFADRGFDDVADYVQEEARWLPPSGEFEAWAAGLGDLRDDVARLEERIRRLERETAAAPPNPVGNAGPE